MKEKYLRHPLFGTSFKNWIRIITYNGGIDKEYYLKAIFVTISIIAFSPARIFFKILYNNKIKKNRIEKNPVFIIGHWRSGTTYLHELICMDPNNSYVSLWNTLLPDSFLILDPIKEIMSAFLPPTRPMDQIKVQIDGPYEEEAALSTLMPWSYFHCFIFPKNAKKQFENSVLFKGLSEEEIKEWKHTYSWFLKAVSYENKNKRLIIKSPSNTSRIKTLLELFPNAYFIFMYRNPYNIYYSTIKMRKKVLKEYALQNTTEEEINKHVIENYLQLMEEYFKQKKYIPKNHLTEISYEELVKNPIKTLDKIYTKFDLKGFNEATTSFEKYLKENKEYKANKYTYDKNIIKKISNKWNYTIKKWGYKPPE
jgi:hypothetical protein